MNDHDRFNLKNYSFWIDDQVRFSDLDPLGHVNNNSVGQYFENARAALYAKITPQWPYGDALFVLAHTAIDFRYELHYPAPIRIGSGVLKMGHTSITIANGLFHKDRGVAYGESVSVLIDNKTRKPIEILAEMRTFIKPFITK